MALTQISSTRPNLGRQKRFEATAKSLVEMFCKNFVKFKSFVEDAGKAAQPEFGIATRLTESQSGEIGGKIFFVPNCRFSSQSAAICLGAHNSATL
jgi:hypothetical protein